jgi:hypothetical protein
MTMQRQGLWALICAAALLSPAAHADDSIFNCDELADYAHRLRELSGLIEDSEIEFDDDAGMNATVGDLATSMQQLARAEDNERFVDAADAMKRAWKDSDEEDYADAASDAGDALASLRKRRCGDHRERERPAPVAGIPPGSYQQSCTDIRMAEGRLHARCRKRDQTLFKSYLNPKVCRSEIVNENGALMCDGYRPRMPGGSFASSCRDARMDGYDLHATCRTRDGRWNDAVLEDTHRCDANGVTNDDGELNCTAKD